jgi:hypothetical protein
VDAREQLVVQESLALMLQMLRLGAPCLEVYSGLAALEVSLEDTHFPFSSYSSQWPLSAEEGDTLTELMTRARGLCSYSINTTRTRLLRNKVTRAELRQYLFARQHFLSAYFGLSWPAANPLAALLELSARSIETSARPDAGLLTLSWRVAGVLGVWGSSSDCHGVLELAASVLPALRSLLTRLKQVTTSEKGSLLEADLLDAPRSIPLIALQALGDLVEGKSGAGLLFTAAISGALAGEYLKADRTRAGLLHLMRSVTLSVNGGHPRATEPLLERAICLLRVESLALWPRLQYDLLILSLKSGRASASASLIVQVALLLTGLLCSPLAVGLLVSPEIVLLDAFAPLTVDKLYCERDVTVPLAACCELILLSSALKEGERVLRVRVVNKAPVRLSGSLHIAFKYEDEDGIEGVNSEAQLCFTSTAVSLTPGESELCLESERGARSGRWRASSVRLLLPLWRASLVCPDPYLSPLLVLGDPLSAIRVAAPSYSLLGVTDELLVYCREDQTPVVSCEGNGRPLLDLRDPFLEPGLCGEKCVHVQFSSPSEGVGPVSLTVRVGPSEQQVVIGLASLEVRAHWAGPTVLQLSLNHNGDDAISALAVGFKGQDAMHQSNPQYIERGEELSLVLPISPGLAPMECVQLTLSRRSSPLHSMVLDVTVPLLV